MKAMRQLAEERGGKCLSSSYQNVHKKLKWVCAQGHQWSAAPHKIIIGRWCPTCCGSRGERICRAYFEQLFQRPFPASKPSWLKNERRNQMELDGYCAPLKLAFEHQGKQHGIEVQFFQRPGTGRFAKQQLDDVTKARLCSERGISLVCVPEIPTLLPVTELRSFIRRECERLGVLVPLSFDSQPVSLVGVYSTSLDSERMEELRAIAASRGGRCLAESYSGSATKVQWCCRQGHIWEATPQSVKNEGTWCRSCADGVKIDGDAIIAGTCKRWRCASGHTFFSVGNAVGHSDRWCPKCRRRSG